MAAVPPWLPSKDRKREDGTKVQRPGSSLHTRTPSSVVQTWPKGQPVGLHSMPPAARQVQDWLQSAERTVSAICNEGQRARRGSGWEGMGRGRGWGSAKGVKRDGMGSERGWGSAKGEKREEMQSGMGCCLAKVAKVEGNAECNGLVLCKGGRKGGNGK